MNSDHSYEQNNSMNVRKELWAVLQLISSNIITIYIDNCILVKEVYPYLSRSSRANSDYGFKAYLILFFIRWLFLTGKIQLVNTLCSKVSSKNLHKLISNFVFKKSLEQVYYDI